MGEAEVPERCACATVGTVDRTASDYDPFPIGALVGLRSVDIITTLYYRDTFDHLPAALTKLRRVRRHDGSCPFLCFLTLLYYY